MPLDDLIQPTSVESEKTDRESSLPELFGRSALYELHQAAFGLAQTVGLQDQVGEMAQPKEAGSFWGQQWQMIGRGAGSFLPTVAVALTTRLAFGKFLGESAASRESALLKRSSLGFTTAEAAATGLISGALFKPTESEKAQDWSSFALDRASGGGAGALSFAALNLSSLAWNKVADSTIVAKLGAERLLKSSVVSGMVSGLPGGLANVEANSLFSEGGLTFDRDKVGRSMYEMMVVGGLLGGTTSLLSRIGRARSGIATEKQLFEEASSVQPADLVDKLKEGEKSLPSFYENGAGEHRLNRLYGADSGRAKTLAAQSVEKAPAPPEDLVAAVAQSGSEASTPKRESANAMQELSLAFGAGSSTVKDLRALENKVSATALIDIASFVDKEPESRKALVEKVIAAGGDNSRLSPRWLESMERLEKRFGADAPLTSALLAVAKVSDQNAIAKAFEKDPHAVTALLKTLTEAGVSLARLNERNIEKYTELSRILSGDATLSKQVFARIGAEVAPMTLRMFLVESPSNLQLLKTIVDLNVDNKYFNSLPILKGLFMYFDRQPELLKQAIAMDERGLSLYLLERAIKENPEQNVELVRQLLLKPDIDLGRDPFAALDKYLNTAKMSRYFGEDPELMKAFAEAYPDWRRTEVTSILSRFMDGDPVNRPAIVRRLIGAGGESYNVGQEQLPGVERLYRAVGSDGDLFERILRLGSDDPDRIAAFVEADPVGHRALLAKVVADERAFVAQIDVARLEALNTLNKELGENSTTMQGLLQREQEGAELDEIASFVRLDPANRSLVEKLVADDAPVSYFFDGQLEPLRRLNMMTGSEFAIIPRLAAYKHPPLDLEMLADFIEGPQPKQDSPLSEPAQERRALVEKLLEEGRPATAFSSWRLAALLELNHEFGEDSSVMQRILAAESRGDAALEAVRQLNQTKIGHLLLLKLAENSEPPAELDMRNYRMITGLENLIQPDDVMARRVAELVQEGLSPDNLVEYLKYASKDRQGQVRRLIQDGASAAELSTERLKALDLLERIFSDRPTVLPRLLALEPDGLKLSMLADFVIDKSSRQELVASLLNEGATAGQLKPVRLAGLEWAHEIYGGTGTLTRLLELEKEGVSLHELESFYYRFSDRSIPKQFIESMLARNLPPEQFGNEELRARWAVSDAFGFDSPAFERLLALGAKGLYLDGLRRLVRELPREHASLIEEWALDGATVRELMPGHLEALFTIRQKIGTDSETTARLRNLVKEGLDPHEAVKFIYEGPSERQMFQELLARGYNSRQLGVANLRDIQVMTALASRFDPQLDALNYLQKLQEEHLSGERLFAYLEERPEQRQAVIAELIKQKADASRFTDQMRLIAFPEPVASHLAQSARHGGMSVPEIIANLRDWRSGRYFQKLVIEQVESGQPTTAEALRSLSARARELAAAGKEGTGAELRDVTPFSTLAGTLRETAERLATVVPKEKPVVLLGRDTWPLLPLVRAKGFDVQYFLWSRENGTDPKTYAQWMKEVPPGAVVIDTGFMGRIINWIKLKDSTASGLLMSASSDSEYDQLLVRPDHFDRTQALENLIKYTAQSKSYTDHGGAIVRKVGKNSDTTVAAKYFKFDGTSRWSAESEIRTMLRDTGLPEWDVWRYGIFVGLTPRERLGLNNEAEVEEHYRRVEQLRRAHQSERSGESVEQVDATVAP